MSIVFNDFEIIPGSEKNSAQGVESDDETPNESGTEDIEEMICRIMEVNERLRAH